MRLCVLFPVAFLRPFFKYGRGRNAVRQWRHLDSGFKRPRAEAVLVRGERIHYVGSRVEATALAGDNAAVIDLKRGMLLPGFVESPIHPSMAGLLAFKLQIIGTRTVAEVQASLADYAAANPDAKSLFGFGFPSALNTAVNAAGVTGPYQKDLDVVSGRPVMLIALDAPSAWGNSKALKVAGINKIPRILCRAFITISATKTAKPPAGWWKERLSGL